MPAAAPSVKAIFDQAAELVPGERSAFLEQACGGDVNVRNRVDALLRAYDQAESFLEPPAPPQTSAFQPATTEQAGTIIGPFKLLQLLGEGGMGEVWMAEQEQPVKRRVALKIIKAGMDSARVIARFEAERQALALMDHPNIAKVLDAGMASPVASAPGVGSGRPYFVMELVKGIPLTKYCDENHLTPKERLELFIPVCQAVQHAHQKGIIHRDLKPSNVLIALYDGKPVPKVIDFGVAKALHQSLTERTMFTEIGSVIGTLEYMSPEQAELNNLDIDTRSDIYSLGVVLYELLTGSRPLDAKRLRSAAFADMLRIIREEEPEKPSTKLSHSGDRLPSISAQRKTEPRKLSKLIRGDLDWIVMKALEKDRARRYETANGFAMDVQRYLAEEPVLAGPPGAVYRMRKFVRRNKAAVLAASLVLLAILAGMGGTWWGLIQAQSERDRAIVAQVEAQLQRQRAEEAKQLADRNFQKARTAVDEYLLRVDENAALTNRADLHDLRKQLLSAAVPFFEEFARDKSHDPLIRSEQGRALSRLSHVRETLGESELAFRDQTKAHEIQSKLAIEFPDQPIFRYREAVCLNDLACQHNSMGRHAEAEKHLLQSLALLEKMAVDFPNFVHARVHLANSLNTLGAGKADIGQSEESIAAYRRAIEVAEKLTVDVPNDARCRHSLALYLCNLGTALNGQKKIEDSESAFRRSTRITRELLAEFPGSVEYQSQLASTLGNMQSVLRSQGRATEADTVVRESILIFEKLAADYPSVPSHRNDLANAKIGIGLRQQSLGQLAEAEKTFRSGIAVQERLVADFPAILDYRVVLAGYYANLARLFAARKEIAVALEGYEKAISLLEGVLAQGARHKRARQYIRSAYHGRAESLRRLGRPGEAISDWERALAVDDGSQRTVLSRQRALTMAEAGQHGEAIAAAERLASEWKTPGASDCFMARVHALSSAAENTNAKLRDEHAAKAVECLRRAQAAGLFKDAKQVENFKKYADLASLRNREDFQKLLAELEGAKP